MTDNEIPFEAQVSQFRSANEAILNDTTHPEHEHKTRELSSMFERKFGTEEVVEIKQEGALPVPEGYDKEFDNFKLNAIPVGHSEPWNNETAGEVAAIFKSAELTGP